jgi:hypothetical protein
MGPHSISRHLPICESSQEGIGGVIGECPAIARKGCWARGIVWQDLRQHCACDPFCLIRRIASGVFRSVREPREETIIIRGFHGEVGFSFRIGKTEDQEESCSLLWFRKAERLFC